MAAIKDMATREIVGWAMDRHMKASLCCDALMMALARRGSVAGLIHHSDRGSQYCSEEYRKILYTADVKQPMSRKGQCLDNAPMERLDTSLKKELVHHTIFVTRKQAKAAISEYIEIFYNRQRRHSAIGYRVSGTIRLVRHLNKGLGKWLHKRFNQTVRKLGRTPLHYCHSTRTGSTPTALLGSTDETVGTH